MWFAIIAQDTPNSLEKRMVARPDHLERLRKLESEDRLLLAGPFPMSGSADSKSDGYSGSLIIADFKNLEDAQVWAEADPYVAAGVYESVTVKPFRKTLPATP